MKRRFEVELTCHVVIEVDDEVIKAVDDEWRGRFYQLDTPEEVAEHIAFNMVAHNATLSSLDGFANQKDSAAEVIATDWEIESSNEEEVE